MPNRTDSLVLSLLLFSACAVDEAETPFEPTFDGPFEVQVQVAEGIDASRIRCGLFYAVAAPAEVTRDGMTTEELAEFWIFQESGGAVMAPGPVIFDSAAFTPVIEYTCNDAGPTLVQLPTNYAQTDDYVPIVWYDANDDGRLDIANVGMTESAKAPGRVYPKLPGMRGFLASIFPTTDRANADGPWEARALSAGLEDGNFVAASSTVLADELTDWSVLIEETTIPAQSFLDE